ncbi:hypothetical protein PoB_003572000 [Plakobranchus ocellatus]|uniref:Uncharacterized protein n=1 Tax=Plakobranchus ocellatus TaxID=259542 RepID=A0AAV4APD6_9GAST|nr:hypothetical protein PoB_003572000 [Plakobranchus ocellatus]
MLHGCSSRPADVIIRAIYPWGCGGARTVLLRQAPKEKRVVILDPYCDGFGGTMASKSTNDGPCLDRRGIEA